MKKVPWALALLLFVFGSTLVTPATGGTLKPTRDPHTRHTYSGTTQIPGKCTPNTPNYYEYIACVNATQTNKREEERPVAKNGCAGLSGPARTVCESATNSGAIGAGIRAIH